MTSNSNVVAKEQESALKLNEFLKASWPWLIATFAAFAFTYYAIFIGLWQDWSTDDNYSHGFLVPLVSAYFLYTRREDILSVEINPSLLGAGLLLIGVLQYMAGYIAVEYFTMRTSIIPVLCGIVLLFMGFRALKALALPILYLIFMIPVPYIIYNSISFSLKLYVTEISVAIIKLMGVVVLNDGNILHFPDVTLEVADACSGMRSLISLAAMGTAFAFLRPFATWKRVVLIVSTLPIAVATNIFRVVVTGLLCQYVSTKAAEGYFHEFAGITVYSVALILLFALSSLLSMGGKK
jgi:exosortase